MKRVLVAAGITASLVLTAACGSTVQQSRTLSSGDGLVTGQQGSTGDLGSTGATSGGTSTSGSTSGTTGVVSSTTGGGATSSTSGGQSVVPGSTGGSQVPVPVSSAVASNDHKPITVGFITTSVGNASSLGINAGQSYSDQSMFSALVADYNAKGGINGHKIIPVYGATDTASSNWSSQFAAVCAKFTQDNHVQVVIGYIFVFLPSFENCLAKAHIPHLYGGYQPGDLVDQKQYPTIVGTGHPSVNGFLLTALDGALRSGLINAKTNLGLIIDDCADGDRAYAQTAKPWLDSHKIKYQTEIGGCAQGSTDVSSATTAVSNAELKFASSGVNLVLGGAIELLLFMSDAQSQGYSPDYFTAVGGAALQANAPASQMKRLHGFGWMPSIDVDQQHQPYGLTASQKTCVARLTRHGLKPSQYNDFMAVYQACDGIDLYAKALAATGSTAAQPIINGVAAALATFPGTGTYNGKLVSASKQRGGPGVYREYTWVDGCSCLTYRGPTYPIPTP